MSQLFGSKRSLNLLLHGMGIVGILAIYMLLLVIRHDVLAQESTIRVAETQAMALLENSNKLHELNVDVRNRLQLAETNAALLKGMIPNIAGEIDFMSQLSELANATDFRIRDFRPGSVAVQSLHKEMEIRFMGEGSYVSFCHFLDGLKNLPRSYRVAQLSVAGPNNGAQHCIVECQLKLMFDLNQNLALGKVSR